MGSCGVALRAYVHFGLVCLHRSACVFIDRGCVRGIHALRDFLHEAGEVAQPLPIRSS